MAGIGRTLLIIVVVLLVAGGAAYFLVPAKASRSESFTVERPAASVFARLASTPGGEQIAEGVTVTEIVSAENNVVVANVAFADGTTGLATYTVAPQGEGAQVELKLEQNLGPNPLDRVKAVTGGEVGSLVAAAAASVTQDLNALPAASFTGLVYSVATLEAKPFFYVENCSDSSADSITSIIGQAVAAIPPVMRAKNLTLDGALTAVEPRVVSGQYCYQVGYPYSGPTPTGALLIGKVGQTPSGTMLQVHYTGAEADVISQVYDPIDALLAAAHLDDPTSTDDDWTTFEVYNDDPTQAGGSRDREIYYVTQGDISRLTTIAAPSAAATPSVAATAPAEAPAATPAPAQ